ncbi:hypothetical protein CO610_07460 [Lysobacteraceae bacterium NML95-0200]|nr:hypothetical protein CO610_07460 [Xanthomonadaceae bacterium NML95-0200]
MNTNTLPATVSFGNTSLTLIDRDGVPYLTAADVARALGYANDNAVSRIYRRNAGEFSEGMSEKVNLALSGNLQKEVRIFSPRGCHLVAMFARTERAAAFRRWVLDVLEGLAQPQPALPSPSYAVLPSQTLSAEQANTLREMMVKGCETVGKHKPGLFMMQGWAKLKAHFKVSYREIPTSQFAEAASLIARHIADWHNGIEDNDPPLQTYHRIRAELFDELLKGANVILNMRKEADRLRALAYGGGSDFMCGLALAMEEAGMHKTAERVRCLNDEQMKAYNAQIIALQSL